MASADPTRDEMNGHYIEVYGPVSESEILETLSSLIGPQSIERPTDRPPQVTLNGGRTIVFVDMDPEPNGPVVLAVGDLDHDDEARERAAESLCRVLASQTPWRLLCSTDTGELALGMRWAC